MNFEVILVVPNPQSREMNKTGPLSHQSSNASFGESAENAIGVYSDEELIKATGLGSGGALGVLFRRYGRPVLNVARRILRDDSEADDLRQEVFLYIVERAKRFDPQRCSASSWIIQIAYHRAIDRRRFLNCRKHYTNEAFDDSWVQSRNERILTNQIDGKAIRERMKGQLSSDQRKVLELHIFHGHTFREIAEELNQTVGNVRHHYYRALERLRRNIFSKNGGQ